MPDPSTPHNSQGIASGTILSDTTLLRQDIPGSEIHTSTPPHLPKEPQNVTQTWHLIIVIDSLGLCQCRTSSMIFFHRQKCLISARRAILLSLSHVSRWMRSNLWVPSHWSTYTSWRLSNFRSKQFGDLDYAPICIFWTLHPVPTGRIVSSLTSPFFHTPASRTRT